MTIPEHCRLERRDPIIAVKTPRAESRFVLRNPARLVVTQLEPEQFFPKGALNCDFVFQVPDKPLEIYVELKGSDFKHALDQLAVSIAQLRSTLQPKLCFLIIRRSPTMDLKTQKLLRDFGRRNKCLFQLKTEHGEYSL